MWGMSAESWLVQLMLHKPGLILRAAEMRSTVWEIPPRIGPSRYVRP